MQYIDYFGFGLHQLVYISRMARPMDAQEIDRNWFRRPTWIRPARALG